MNGESGQAHRKVPQSKARTATNATGQKVASFISDELVECFDLSNPSSRSMALGLTRPLKELSTRNLSGAKRGRRARLTTSPPSHVLLKLLI
jgi:hypothetical protein